MESPDASVVKGASTTGTPWRGTYFGISTGGVRRGTLMETENGRELITVQAAADRLAVSRWMVYQLIWDQQVKSVQIGRCRRIVRQSLDDYLSGLIEGAA
jgi:excisionase family DNA binding protein